MSDKVTHISQLNFDQRNPRKHNPRNIGVVVDSLQKVGAARSIVIDENNQILAGNGVTEAATLAGIEKVVEVEADGNTLIAVRRRDLTDEQKQALKYYDNRSSELAEWSADVILADFEAGAVDFSQLWNEAEWSDLLESFGSELLGGNGAGGDAAPQITETEAEKLQKLWQTEPGQIWQLGRHRIACLDSTDEETVKRLVEGLAVGMVWADPPYGISAVGNDGTVGYSFYPKGVYGQLANKNVYAPIVGDDTPETALKAFVICQEMTESKQIWWGGNYYAYSLPPSRCWVIWDKQTDGNEFADCEIAWTNATGRTRLFRHAWNGMIKASERSEKRVHPTQKPVALANWCFREYGESGDVIFDPFLGSGISILAAEQLNDGRAVVGCELSPDYIAVCLERFKQLTGITPQLISG